MQGKIIGSEVTLALCKSQFHHHLTMGKYLTSLCSAVSPHKAWGFVHSVTISQAPDRPGDRIVAILEFRPEKENKQNHCPHRASLPLKAVARNQEESPRRTGTWCGVRNKATLNRHEQYSHRIDNSYSYLTGFLWKLNELIHTKHLALG